MARYIPNTYKNHKTARFIAKLAAVLLLIVIVLFVALFFGLRRHIVYTPDGLRLDIPWLQELEDVD